MEKRMWALLTYAVGGPLVGLAAFFLFAWSQGTPLRPSGQEAVQLLALTALFGGVPALITGVIVVSGNRPRSRVQHVRFSVIVGTIISSGLGFALFGGIAFTGVFFGAFGLLASLVCGLVTASLRNEAIASDPEARVQQ